MFCANVLTVSERINSLNVTSIQMCNLLNQHSLEFYDFITSDGTSVFVVEVIIIT